MMGRMLAGGAAGYLMTGDMGGALGGAAMAGPGFGIGKGFLRKRGGAAGLGQTALRMAAKAGPESLTPSLMKHGSSSSYFGAMGVLGKQVDIGALKGIKPGANLGKNPGIRSNRSVAPMTAAMGNLSNIKQIGKPGELNKVAERGYQEAVGRSSSSFGANIQRGHEYLGQNRINTNKFGGYALGAMGMMAASRMGSNLINSNRGY